MRATKANMNLYLTVLSAKSCLNSCVFRHLLTRKWNCVETVTNFYIRMQSSLFAPANCINSQLFTVIVALPRCTLMSDQVGYKALACNRLNLTQPYMGCLYKALISIVFP